MNAFIKTEVTSATEALEDAAIRWSRAKAAEQSANKERLAIEAEIARLVGVAEEGTTNAETANFKIKTVGKLTRSLDSAFPIQTHACSTVSQYHSVMNSFFTKPTLDMVYTTLNK